MKMNFTISNVLSYLNALHTLYIVPLYRALTFANILKNKKLLESKLLDVNECKSNFNVKHERNRFQDSGERFSSTL